MPHAQIGPISVHLPERVEDNESLKVCAWRSVQRRAEAVAPPPAANVNRTRRAPVAPGAKQCAERARNNNARQAGQVPPALELNDELMPVQLVAVEEVTP